MKKINSAYCVMLVILTQITSFVPMGINLTVLNPTVATLEVFINDTFQKRFGHPASSSTTQLIIAFAQASLVAGSVLGALVVRLSLVYFSRRSNLVAIHITSILSCVLMSPIAKFCNSYEALIVGRFINGMARGMTLTVCPLYVAEIVSRKTLALYQTPSGWLIQVGSAIGNALGHPDVLGGIDTWPYLLAFPALFSLMYMFFLPWIPETLTYMMIFKENQSNNTLTQTGRMKKTSFKLLAKLRYGDGKNLQHEHEKLQAEISAERNLQKASVCEILKDAGYRKQLFAATILMLAAQFVGLQIILQYTNTVLKAVGIDDESATFYSIGLFIVMIFVAILSTPLLTRFGSRRMLLNGLFIACFGLALLMLSTQLRGSIPDMSYVSIVSLIIHTVGAGSGPVLTITALPSEVTTQVTRPTILWLSGLIFWTIATIVAFATPYAIDGLQGFTYIIFIGLILFEIIYIIIFIPSTHKRSVEEIQEKLRNKQFRIKYQRVRSPFHPELAVQTEPTTKEEDPITMLEREQESPNIMSN